MEFMILRRADLHTQAGVAPFAARTALDAGVTLLPGAARLLRHGGQWQLVEGPFEPSELVAGFMLLEASSLPEAVAQVRQWPLADEGAVLEVRAAGCPGGCVGFDQRGTAAGTLPVRRPALQRYVVFVRSSAQMERDLVPPPEVIAAMGRRNEEGVRAGVLLAGEGLKSSAKGARVKFTGATTTVVDGPFTEIKELIAGYWMLQAASREEVIAWAIGYPFAQAGDLMLEIREVREPVQAGVCTPEQWRDEQRMRARQLETGMQAELARPGGR